MEVISVRCKVGGIRKEIIGIRDEQKIFYILNRPRQWETICSPISQAEILNDLKMDFNILVGLCVGHASLFYEYAKAPVTALIVKDRVFGHSPTVDLYQSHAYYQRLIRKKILGRKNAGLI